MSDVSIEGFSIMTYIWLGTQIRRNSAPLFSVQLKTIRLYRGSNPERQRYTYSVSTVLLTAFFISCYKNYDIYSSKLCLCYIHAIFNKIQYLCLKVQCGEENGLLTVLYYFTEFMSLNFALRLLQQFCSCSFWL